MACYLTCYIFRFLRGPRVGRGYTPRDLRHGNWPVRYALARSYCTRLVPVAGWCAPEERRGSIASVAVALGPGATGTTAITSWLAQMVLIKIKINTCLLLFYLLGSRTFAASPELHRALIIIYETNVTPFG